MVVYQGRIQSKFHIGCPVWEPKKYPQKQKQRHIYIAIIDYEDSINYETAEYSSKLTEFLLFKIF